MSPSSDTSSLSASVMNLSACSLGLTNQPYSLYGIGVRQKGQLSTQDHCAFYMVLQELLALMKLSLDSIHTAISLAAVHDIIKNTLRQPEKGNRWSTVVFISSITGNFTNDPLSQLALVNVVQILYTLRLWIVSERQYYKQLRWLTGLCGSAVAVSIGCNIARAVSFAPAAVYYACVLGAKNDMPLKMIIVKAQLSVYLSIGSWLLADFIIATSLCYVLHTSKNGFLSTDSFLNRYMAYFYLALGNSIVLFGCGLVVEKLYINSYMAMLNGRKFMRQEPEHSESAPNCTEGQIVDICRATLQQEHGKISKDLESGCTATLTQAHDIIICLESVGAPSIDL
ncbi:hypothetical protein FIBSPDRAFT_885037 [Athelia psychrophila]|uniref:DUF6534 domain-containing protein n=1 Tax=Athelia psychrophila TaxID=1759441 RepID=A0A166SBP8_9AGAM|nr:hypothetical protein FIBSPDRAFT_885037 [Fibularhizoctonia sp. CBS 109695]